MGLGSNAMYVLTPRLNTYISVQLGWGLSVAMAVWTCLGVSGEHMLMVTFYWQASPQGSMPVLHLLGGFRSAWATRWSDKREFWHGGGRNFTFIGAEMWEYSPQTIKISNFAHKFATRLHSFHEMLSVCTRL